MDLNEEIKRAHVQRKADAEVEATKVVILKMVDDSGGVIFVVDPFPKNQSPYIISMGMR